MSKGLKLHALARDGAHLVQRELARERHTRHAQLAAPGSAASVVHVSLRGDVALNLGPAAAHLGEKAPVLDDEGVGAQEPGTADKLEHLRNLARGNGDVHRHVDARAGEVRPAARLAKGLVRKVVRAAAGVEVVAQAAVDGVGAGSQRGVERLGTSGWRQELYAPCSGQDLLLVHWISRVPKIRHIWPRCGMTAPGAPTSHGGHREESRQTSLRRRKRSDQRPGEKLA